MLCSTGSAWVGDCRAVFRTQYISWYDINRTNAVKMTSEEYRALADFRYHIRRFVHFSEQAAREEGLEPQQHQMMLAIRGLESTEGPTVGALAAYLMVRHHSAVGLIDRLEERGLASRKRGAGDRRQVTVRLTSKGSAVLERLSGAHRAELADLAPHLVEALEKALTKQRI
jgi:DNA-binding MarR family transcriptional regulator